MDYSKRCSQNAVRSTFRLLTFACLAIFHYFYKKIRRNKLRKSTINKITENKHILLTRETCVKDIKTITSLCGGCCYTYGSYYIEIMRAQWLSELAITCEYGKIRHCTSMRLLFSAILAL